MALLSDGGVAVVVGGRASNFSPELRDNAQLVFWDQNAPELKRREIPANAKAVVFSRFVSHKDSVPLIEEAKKRRLVCFPPQRGTGAVKRTLEFILGLDKVNGGSTIDQVEAQEEPAVAEKPTEPSELKFFGRGELASFIKEHVNVNAKASFEVARLLKLAEARGYQTTKPSLATTYYRVRHDLREASKGIPEPSRESAFHVHQADPIIVKTLDEVIAGLQLIRESLATLENENLELRQKLRQISHAANV